MVNGARPLISVITPAFNRADYLGTAIESVLAQTYPHFEMHVVDDGSTDGTPALMERYRDDERIHYHRQANQGQSVARNLGIAHSSGDYICFLDSDDAFLPTKLEESVTAFQDNPQAGVVYGDYIMIDHAGNEWTRENMPRHSGAITARLLRDNFVSMNTTMSRRHLIREAGGFDPDDRLAEDYGLWLRISALARFQYVPRYWTYYRVMADQISSNKLARLAANEAVLSKFLDEHPGIVSPVDVRRAWAGFHLRMARHRSRAGLRAGALASVVRACRFTPFNQGPWRTLARVALDGVRPAASHR